MMMSVFDRVDDFVRKEGNTGYQHFLPFLAMFSNRLLHQGQ